MIILRVAFYTLGCKVNQYETSAIMEDFIRDGFEVVEPSEEADVYLLNSCTVTAESDKKTRQLLRRFRRLSPTAVIAICGCFPQAFPDAAKALPEADVIIGASNKKQILPAVKQRLAGGEKVVNIIEYAKDEGFATTQVASFGERTRAFVKIQDGCQRYCAYCIIPYARGPVRSKMLGDLKAELESLADSGYKEVVLVGINLSCYGVDQGGHLLDAIRLACSIEGIQRVRLGSLEPELLSSRAIAQMGDQPKLCPQFHLSLQSGSDETLKRMRRHYDTEEYCRIVSNLREAFPGCAITTDIMVGFPGETEEEFNQSLEFIKEIRLARAHVFAYSRREGTAAYSMEGQLSKRDKSHRSALMIAATDESRIRFLHQQIGTVQPVLFENKEVGLQQGYTPNYTHVSVKHSGELGGRIALVKLVGVEGDSCIGVLE